MQHADWLGDAIMWASRAFDLNPNDAYGFLVFCLIVGAAALWIGVSRAPWLMFLCAVIYLVWRVL